MGNPIEPVYVSRIEELLRLKSEMVGERVRVSDLADYVGVSRQTVQTWLSPRGVKNLPTASHQFKLEQFFAVTFDKIWTLKSVETEGGDEPGQRVAEFAR